uniref:C-type lectin domain-containing protein n=1 Tax=Panagrolaimus davidi TaxID=227884 RepID=A0A914QVQ3_9BILA
MLLKQAHVIFLAALFYYGFATDATCPPGAVLSPFDPNVCYLFSANATDYFGAADFCENIGGHLSSVHGAFENNYFRGAASSSDVDSFWIGGSDVNLNGTWNWEDRSPFDWTDWAPGQPNRTAGLCLYVSNHNGYWYGDGCTLAKPFMCKVNPSKQGLASCPNGMISTYPGNNGSVIGLIADKNEWRWQDNTMLNYTRWNSASDSQILNDSCLLLYGIKGSVNWFSYQSQSPSSVTEVVCELNGYENSRKAVRDSACPKGTFESPDNTICYKVYSDASNWFAAEQTCLKENGHLVSVHNSDVNSFLLGVLPFKVPGAVDFWIGGSSDTTWKWSDGTPFDFKNWAPGNPLSDSGLCTSEKVRSGYWYSTKCDETKPFICTVPPSTLPRPSCPPNFSYYDVTNKCYQVSLVLLQIFLLQ